MTVEDIYSDREGFAKNVRAIAGPDVSKMGIRIISFVIQNITDNVDYLKSLGVKRAAEVKRDADVGVAKCISESGIKVLTVLQFLKIAFKLNYVYKTDLFSRHLKQNVSTWKLNTNVML